MADWVGEKAGMEAKADSAEAKEAKEAKAGQGAGAEVAWAVAEAEDAAAKAAD